MLRGLIVNDDGYKSGGIRALLKELSAHDQVVAVAPSNQQSWKGKSITGHAELTLKPVTYLEFDGYEVTGTPADCTQLGIYELMSSMPDYVLSGLNDGANIGHSHILSSGTVGAALEAALQGLPAFASSVWGIKDKHPGYDFEGEEAVELFKIAAIVTRKIVHKVMASGFPSGVQMVCINVPHNVTEDSEIVITTPHRISYGRLFSHRGEGVYYNVGSAELEDTSEQETDLHALARGKVSVVPITVELTSEFGQKELSKILNAPVASA